MLGLCRIKSTDATVPQAVEPLSDGQPRVKLSPDKEDISANQSLGVNTGLTQIESSQTGDDVIDEEQQEDPSSMQFGSMHM